MALEKLLDDRDIEDDRVGFHAKQAAEKMLAALFAARGVDYPKTHNLRVLIELTSGQGIRLPEKLAEIDRLTQFGTTFRYDSISIHRPPPTSPITSSRRCPSGSG